MSYHTSLAALWSFGEAFDSLLSHSFALPPYHSTRSDIDIVFYRLQKMYMSELACRTQTTIPRRPLASIPTGNVYEDYLTKHKMVLDHFLTLLDVIEVNEPNYKSDRKILEIVNREIPRTRSVLKLIERIIQNDLSPDSPMDLGQILHPVSLLSSPSDSKEFSSLFKNLPTPIGPPKKREEKVDLDILNSMVESLGGWTAARMAVESRHHRSSSPSAMTSSDSGQSSPSSGFNSSDSEDSEDSNDIRALFLYSVASKIAADPTKEEWKARVKQSENEIREQRRIAEQKSRKVRKLRSAPAKKRESEEEKEYRIRMEGKMKEMEKKRAQEKMEEEFRRNQEEIAKRKEEERRQMQEKIRLVQEAKKAKKLSKKKKTSSNLQSLSSSSSSSDEAISHLTSEVSEVVEIVKKEETEEMNRPSFIQRPFIEVNTLVPILMTILFIGGIFFVI